MKLNSIALALVSAIALTACGGSGSNLSAVNNSDHADKSSNRGGSYNQGSYKQGSHSKDSQSLGPQILGPQSLGSQSLGSQGQSSQGQGSQGQGSQGQGSQGQGSQGQGSQGQGSQGQGSQTPQTQVNNRLTWGDFKDKTGDFSGAYINYKREDGKTDTIESNGLTTVRINGDDFSFKPDDEKAGKSYMLGSGHYGETKLSSVRYGIIHADNDFIVAQGLATKEVDVPTTGEANYKGEAIYSAGDKLGTRRVNSTFKVNFGKHELVGVIGDIINSQDFESFNIKADIEGNHFKGDYKGFHTQGQFYGVKAAELAGTFAKNDNTVAGAFGAKKVK